MSSPHSGIAPVSDDALSSPSSGSSFANSYTSESEHYPHRQPLACRWRTDQFNNQECARYFDCPSHLVERALSASDSTEQEQEQADVGEGSSAGAALQVGQAEGHSTPPSNSNKHPGRLLADTPSAAIEHDIQPDIQDVSSHVQQYSESPDGQELAEEASSPPFSSRLENTDVAEPPGRENTSFRVNNRPRSWADYAFLAQQRNQESAENINHTMQSDATHDGTRRQQQQQQNQHVTGLGLSQSSQPSSVFSSADRRITRSGDQETTSREFVLPRWQPDAEVTFCPICHTQFGIFLRKHHCRKCGRVVCGNCSPHRIIIPHQYIVRPPGYSSTMPASLLVDGVSYFGPNGVSGGERVRLCNPCVPDPNTAPPVSPIPLPVQSPRSPHHRSRSSLSGLQGHPHPSNRYGAIYHTVVGGPPMHVRHSDRRSRSNTTSPAAQSSSSSALQSQRVGLSYASSHPLYRFIADASGSSTARTVDLPAALRRHSIAEEDECPVCHHELPDRSLPDFESLREAHISQCVEEHVQGRRSGLDFTSTSVPGDDAVPAIIPRRQTGMYTYSATEKDCVDDAECTICLEEFLVGVPMARLECLCRFHRSCITAWFVTKPGRCPIHQHDAFGY